MFKRNKIFIAVLAVTAVLGAGVASKCYWFGSCGVKLQLLSQTLKITLSAELVQVVREKPMAELRSWLVKQTPFVSGQVILSLDNNSDPHSRARMAALEAIHTLDTAGIDDERRKEWALVLRDLAHSMLHTGAKRSEYIAKSYVMEGRINDAAAAYRSIPDSVGAKVFFGANPELRSPASHTR